MRMAFKRFDKNHNGRIDINEAMQLVQMLSGHGSQNAQAGGGSHQGGSLSGLFNAFMK
jgi:hypothetical protein